MEESSTKTCGFSWQIVSRYSLYPGRLASPCRRGWSADAFPGPSPFNLVQKPTLFASRPDVGVRGVFSIGIAIASRLPQSAPAQQWLAVCARKRCRTAAPVTWTASGFSWRLGPPSPLHFHRVSCSYSCVECLAGKPVSSSLQKTSVEENLAQFQLRPVSCTTKNIDSRAALYGQIQGCRGTRLFCAAVFRRDRDNNHYGPPHELIRGG